MKNVFLFTVLISSFAFAVNAPISSVSAGSGGGGAASVEIGEASFMNPATLTHLKGRYFYTSFQHNLFALSITQNDKQSAVPGALSYFADDDLQMFALSFSDFVYEEISVGISLNYWQAEFDRFGKRQTNINGNAGIIWTPTEKLGIGFAAESMFERSDEFKAYDRITPTSRFGLNYLYQEWFRWRLDFVTFKNNQWDNWVPQAGLESYVSKWFILRTGVSRPPGLKESWSAGFGFDLPRFRLDYASQWHVNGGNDHRHYVDLGVPF